MPGQLRIFAQEAIDTLGCPPTPEAKNDHAKFLFSVFNHVNTYTVLTVQHSLKIIEKKLTKRLFIPLFKRTKRYIKCHHYLHMNAEIL